MCQELGCAGDGVAVFELGMGGSTILGCRWSRFLMAARVGRGGLRDRRGHGRRRDRHEPSGLAWHPVGISWSALYAYRKVEVVGDRHRHRYLGPWGSWHWSQRHGGLEDLTGWDVLVVQKELGSGDRRKLRDSPRVADQPVAGDASAGGLG